MYHTIGDASVPQTKLKGYINATVMCHAVGKKFQGYTRMATTKEFIVELSDDLKN